MPTTAPHQNHPGPALVPLVRRPPAGFPLDGGRVNLTVRRITKNHHGRTLQMLGHAAEYLAYNRGFSERRASAADDEAISILRRLSSAVFLEYAEGARVRRPLEDFVMGCASWLLE
ncbi:hypothetical protein GCM10011507_07300 [Edaphobacter acidisoli]|uniref:Uncharacterized protein n=1 Tax=Edaphobacter acidisoli TaxID=2040573 RepID=A0A916RI79_9BACT|nr:hypothetical protein [Edaphobacter acidisoli]GGA58480.1 hypothetical protein GCM10011507_07300 [Edaphobacter acidisoli]